MKRIEKIIAASSFMFGSLFLYLAVSNLEYESITNSPYLIDWRVLAVLGIIVYIPYFIIIVRKEIKWHEIH